LIPNAGLEEDIEPKSENITQRLDWTVSPVPPALLVDPFVVYADVDPSHNKFDINLPGNIFESFTKEHCNFGLQVSYVQATGLFIIHNKSRSV